MCIQPNTDDDIEYEGVLSIVISIEYRMYKMMCGMSKLASIQPVFPKLLSG